MEHASAARIPTMWGPFTAYCYRSILDGIEHIAMVKVCIRLFMTRGDFQKIKNYRLLVVVDFTG